MMADRRGWYGRVYGNRDTPNVATMYRIPVPRLNSKGRICAYNKLPPRRTELSS